MNENSVCPIWGTAASVGGVMNRPGVEVVDSPRACGEYVIFRRARIMLKNRDERFKARLTTWLIEQRRLGVEHPEITEHTIPEIEKRRDLSVHERADRLLRYLGQLEQYAGAGIGSITSEDNRFLNMLAWLESTVNTSAISSQRREVQFFLNYLETQGWIETLKFEGRETDHITVEGYARLAELDNVATDSSQAFVAMWFDDSMSDVYENSVRPGIEDAGYEARRIDRIEHINKIDDEIIAEIRRSRFVVADFTHGDTGARGGVYYEAGFAHGLNIPVIFTCRKDVLEDIHFDTRQYNHIPWEPEKLVEFRKALSDRISAVIGDYPNKRQNAV